MHKLGTVILTATLSFSPFALADHDGMKHNSKHDKGTHAFMGADKDNDGTLDREEAKKLPRVSKHFDAIDTNKDGTVDREEIHKYMTDHPKK